jgi:hypothetical protein
MKNHNSTVSCSLIIAKLSTEIHEQTHCNKRQKCEKKTDANYPQPAQGNNFKLSDENEFDIFASFSPQPVQHDLLTPSTESHDSIISPTVRKFEQNLVDQLSNPDPSSFLDPLSNFDLPSFLDPLSNFDLPSFLDPLSNLEPPSFLDPPSFFESLSFFDSPLFSEPLPILGPDPDPVPVPGVSGSKNLPSLFNQSHTAGTSSPCFPFQEPRILEPEPSLDPLFLDTNDQDH